MRPVWIRDAAVGNVSSGIQELTGTVVGVGDGYGRRLVCPQRLGLLNKSAVMNCKNEKTHTYVNR